MANITRNVHLKNNRSYNLIFVLLILIISSCSTKKNTWASRAFQDLNTRYNVYFNGYLSYNEGLKNIQKANKEDYSTILPMYPISHHSNATSATTNMDRTIEKCRKAIKLHSIKVKPEKNYKKWNKPDYQMFYNQEEFNPALKQAWILLGEAEFHKADFLGAAGTFTYIAHHYSLDKDMIATCQLWIVRAYGEMGWIYEAEQVLSKIKQDDLNQSNIGLFASVNADLLLKRHLYKEAIPFLQLALSKEKDNYLRQRFSYLLAQLYQKTGDNQAAYATFSKVIKMNPPFEMDFNARINRAQLAVGNIESIRKGLRKMLKNSNNKDYIDQIYYALGNTYFQRGDTAKAIENFKLSIAKSTRNGLDKGLTLITLGDIYYHKQNYIKAQPCYDEAGKIISNENEDYARVTRLGETLSELVTQNDVVVLQDSLQRLALLPENKRLEVVNKIIEKLIADEKAATDKATKEAQDAINQSEIGMMPPIGMNVPAGTGSWYFYNPDIVKSGQVEFIKKWGNRKLEDNWRRYNKSASLFNEDISKNVSNDSASTATKTNIVEITDNKKPEFYLKQIPVTPAQIQKSNEEIADALYAMGQIYKDKIEDYPLAINTFKEFIHRFSADERVPDAYFQMYLIETKNGNQTEADFFRTKLITEFPNSKYHEILSQPDYADRMEKMYREQDSLYSLTYKAYNDNDFKTVFKQVDYIRKNYPLSTLMPKFLFLNALSIGKNESSDKFKVALDSLVSNYPQSDVSGMAKDILALIKQGKEAQQGTTSGTLLTRREESTKTVIEATAPQQFSTDRQGKHRVLLICADSLSEMNKLQYNIASFNFSRFLIKDFDLVINKLDSVEYALSVTNLESYDEAQWYLNTLNSDMTVSALLAKMKAREIIISEDNYGLLRTSLNLNDYLAFLNNQKGRVQKTNEVAIRTPQKHEQKTVNEIQKAEISQNTMKPVEAKTDNSMANPVDKPIAKPEVITEQKPAKTTVSTATTDSKASKPADIQTKKVETPINVQPPVNVQPKVEEVPLYKGLYGYRANEPHFIAIDVLSGKFDFDKLKAAFNAYNSQNYGIMNLKISVESINNQQVIIIGSFSNAQIAKSYLLRMVKENSLFTELKNADYRNLLGSQKNLNVAIQQPSLNTYFDFMQEYYLK